VLQVLLLAVDGFPVGLSALSIVSHAIYAQNLRRFPIVKLTDPLFLVSCGRFEFQLFGSGCRDLFGAMLGCEVMRSCCGGASAWS